MNLREYKEKICLKVDDLERIGKITEMNGLQYAVDLFNKLDISRGCESCGRAFCSANDGTIRVNCPLWKGVDT